MAKVDNDDDGQQQHVEQLTTDVAEDLLSEVYMPPSIGTPSMMCLEDSDQLTVPIALRQQQEHHHTANHQSTASGSNSSCTKSRFVYILSQLFAYIIYIESHWTRKV